MCGPEKRNVSIAIGHGLAPYLDDADDWNECAEIPEPADRQISEPPFAPDKNADE